MNNQTPRVLFLALDSADPTLIERMIAQGQLPHIGQLISSGLSGRIDVPKVLGNGVIWPTLNTGVNAGHHGRYFYTQIAPGSYKTRTFREDRDLAHAPFWKYLSDAGRRILVIDAYKAPLIEGLNGIQILDWASHGFYPHNQPRSSPKDLIKEVHARYGLDPLGGSIDIYMRSHPDVFELADLLITRCRAKTEYAIELMQREPWTFAIIGFAEAHDIGHFAWHMHDQDHPLFDRYKVASHGDPVEKVYVELDTAIGKLVDNAKDDSEIILFAGTGMENNFSANTGLDRILSLLEKSSRSTETPSKFADNSGHKTDFLALWNRLPPWLKKLRGIRNLRRSAMEHNRAASLCFALPYDDHCGAIRLNLKGREKHGRLAPGVEASSFCQRLIQELMAITYEETGEPLVKEVIPAEALFSGDRLGQLPDLFVIWNRDRHPLWTPDHSYTVVKSPTFGSMNIGPTIRTGDHTSEAMLILTGKGVPIGENISHMSLEDIAPTLCSLLGMVLPDTDGQAIPELRIHN